MNKILITGGAGFIGSSLVEVLVSSNRHYQVVVYDNLSSATKDNISHWSQSPNFEFIQADMLDSHNLDKIVNACDAVFHLAANPIVALGATNTKIDYELNLQATYNLLESMRKSNNCKSLIFTSTSAVYGEVDKIPIPENYSPLKPISLYGATKLACEAMICGYCHMFDMSCIAVRLANIIGPAETHGVIYDLITKLSSNPDFLEILGNGMQNKSYMHISDCIASLIKLFELVEKNRFEVFNVGSDDTVTVSDIAEIVIKEFGSGKVQKRFIDKYDGKGWIGDVKEYLLDSSRMKSMGWAATYNSRDAVILTVRQCLSKKLIQ